MYFQLFQGINRYWFWRLYSEDNQKLAFSSQGYETREDALKSIQLIQKNISHVAIEDLT